MTNMMRAIRRVTSTISPVRARAKVLARENREMKSELIRARHALGLTQQDVAERMGCTQQAVYKLERYDSDPRLSTLERYANAIGALVHHRVEIDHGQSIRLAQTSGWAAPRITVQRSRPLTATRAEHTFDGWLGGDRVELLHGAAAS